MMLVAAAAGAACAAQVAGEQGERKQASLAVQLRSID